MGIRGDISVKLEDKIREILVSVKNLANTPVDKATEQIMENIAKEPLHCASCGDEMDKDCPKCLKFAGVTK